MLELIAKLLKEAGRSLTEEEAIKLGNSIPEDWFMESAGMGYKQCVKDPSVVRILKNLFPEYKWNVIIDRSACYSYGRITPLKNDPRRIFDKEKHKGCCRG